MNYRRISTRILSTLFPQFNLLKLIRDTVRDRQLKPSIKMKLSVKVLIGSGVTLFVIIAFGFIGFPKFLKSQIKKQIALKPTNEIRDMYVKVPFPLEFKIYVFNVTNYLEVAKGDTPVLDEIGPFFYEEWKEKVDVVDNEAEDSLTFKMKNTFIFNKEKSYPLTGNEIVTVPHPLMVVIALAVELKSPGLLSLVNGALKALFQPEHPFLTASVNDIFFNGIVINCTTDDFKAQTLCTKLRTEGEDLEIVSDTIFKFSLLGAKNATAGKPYTVLRGVKDYRDVGRVTVYNGKDNIDIWPTEECNKFEGTDGTIFPPLLREEQGLISFSPELCRSFAADYHSDTVYAGIPVRKYTADFGDMSTDPALKCFCYTNTTCLKRGTMDLTKCADAPIIVSLPHFYLSDESYLKGVRGLRPNEEEHGIVILFESITGSPLYAKKRLQFNFPLKPIKKVSFMKTLPEALTPVFWIEEGVELNSTFTKPLKNQLFRTMKIMNVIKWIVAVAALIGLGIGGFLHVRPEKAVTITPVNSNGNNKINEPQKNVISMINSNLDNRERTNGLNMPGKQYDKY